MRFSESTGAFVDAFVPQGAGGLVQSQGLAFGPDGSLYVTCGTDSPNLPRVGGIQSYQGKGDGYIAKLESLRAHPEFDAEFIDWAIKLARVVIPLWAGFSYDHFGKTVPLFTSAALVLATIALGYGIDDGRKAELRVAS